MGVATGSRVTSSSIQQMEPVFTILLLDLLNVTTMCMHVCACLCGCRYVFICVHVCMSVCELRCLLIME